MIKVDIYQNKYKKFYFILHCIMTAIRQDFVVAAIDKAYILKDSNIYDNLEKIFKFRKQTILADESLTKDEKSYAIKLLDKDNDFYKLLYSEGTKTICDNCQDS